MWVLGEHKLKGFFKSPKKKEKKNRQQPEVRRKDIKEKKKKKIGKKKAELSQKDIFFAKKYSRDGKNPVSEEVTNSQTAEMQGVQQRQGVLGCGVGGGRRGRRCFPV